MRDNKTAQIIRMERRHDTLKQQVAALDRQLTLSSREQLRVSELKREKLAAKDAIIYLRRA